MRVFIIPTSNAEHLAKKIKDKTVRIVFPEKNKNSQRLFPDGEVYIKLPSVFLASFGSRDRIIILHSGMPRPNEGLIELELILQILKERRVKPEVFFAYFPYGMQDKIFEKGETNAAENLIKKLINYYGVKKIYIIDPHFGNEKWIRKYPITSISAVPILIKKAKADFGSKILFLSPDKGGQRRTKILGIKKKRKDSFRVEYFSPKIFLKEEIIGVVDDILETGGTLLRFFELLKKSGAKKVIVLITHGIIPAGVSKIKERVLKLYLTNSVSQKETNVDISPLILENIL